MSGDGESKLTGMDAQVAMAQLRQGFRGMKNMPFLGSMSGLSRIGSTNFEERELNAMLDMVDNAKPSDLTATGGALEQAAKDIKRIGDDLKKHVGEVAWEGKGGSSFHKWGGKLGSTTLDLAEYTFTAASQLKSAGEGLAAVKAAMPPRDSRILQKAPEDIPAAKRVETNDEYTAAVKTEKHRQEAITQMNKLSSYYQVTHDTIAMQPEPVFEPMEDPQVPRPVRGFEVPGGVPAAGGASGTSPAAPGEMRESVAASINAGGDNSVGTSAEPSPVLPDHAVGTSTDSVASSTAAAPLGTHHTPTAPVSGSGPAQHPGSVPFMTSAPPMRVPGVGGIPRTATPLGRSTGSGGPSEVRRPIGRNLAPGPTEGSARSGSASRTGGPGQGERSLPGRNTGTAGRPSPVSGRSVGRPASNPMSGRAFGGAARSARGDGVVGGQPSGQATSGRGAAVPRGGAVGGERGVAAGRGVVRPGRAGDGRKVQASPQEGGVSGRPRSLASTQGRSGEFTQGGTGLLHRKGNEAVGTGRGIRSVGRERSEKLDKRPDFLTEDEETWVSGRPRAMPSVIE